MTDQVRVHDLKAYLRTIRREVLRELRTEARRVRRSIAASAPKETGQLRRKLKVKAGIDATGPWARVITTARRTTTSERTGRKTTYRYGLAIQQKTRYLQRGLQRTPRR